MPDRTPYAPSPPRGAEVRKDGETWTLVLARELRHAPEIVWRALTEPVHLREWAPFDADGSLGTAGRTVTLSTVGTPAPQVSATTVKRADAPRLLEYTWGGGDLRWELEPLGAGTRLTLWHNIDRRFISWGAAGWHICLDVLDRLLAGTPIGRIAGPEVMKFGGWQRLTAEYARRLGVEPAGSPSTARNVDAGGGTHDMKRSAAVESGSAFLDQKIKALGDWRGQTLAKVRHIIHAADPEIVEEWKWVKPTSGGTPVWSHSGGICTGETYKSVVKLTFFRGASLRDPARLFNSSLDGNVRRAIDIHEGDKIDEPALKNLIRAAVALNCEAKAR